VKLRELLDGVDVRSSGADGDIEISSVTSDSRQCRPGSLFVAIPGFQQDGTAFVDSAVRNGATAVVAERSVPLRVPLIETPDARAAAAIIAANYYGRPGSHLTLIGVTGTSGKTTTTKMIESIIDATGEPAGLVGTIEYRAGELRELADRTTPDSMVLQQWLATMVEQGVRRAVMEVSSHALVLKRTWGLHFGAAVFTNLSRDHFDFHKDFEDYFAAKRLLFEQIDRSRRCAVVNIDDPYGRRLRDEMGPAAMTFGMTPEADIHPADAFGSAIEGLSGTVVTPAGEVNVQSSLVGLPNLSNWMGAIGAALATGISVQYIEEGIRSLKTVRGRFERIASDKATVLVDYAHKPDALEKLLHAVRAMAPDRKILLVFGCGGDRDQGKRPLMGEIAGRLADMTFITSDNPRSEDPAAIIRQIEEGMIGAGGSGYVVEPDRRRAIERAMEAADGESVVVVAGKGHENYQVIGERIVHFDDREEVQQALEKKQHKQS
jgi:UDP-N-acetylmuramoyl-L-alanyl-D-glutamate--2,6-diaminopimelate ligase